MQTEKYRQFPMQMAPQLTLYTTSWKDLLKPPTQKTTLSMQNIPTNIIQMVIYTR